MNILKSILMVIIIFVNINSTNSASLTIYTGNVKITKEVKSAQAIKEENVVIQTTEYTCGAAALATLINSYLGGTTTETEVLKLANPEPERGLNLLQLKRVAEAKGYKAVGYRMNIKHLQNLNHPVLLFVKFEENKKHFTIFKGIRGNRVFLADPSQGNIRMSIDKFLTIWNGITLVVKPKDGSKINDHLLKIKQDGLIQPELLSIKQMLNTAHEVNVGMFH
jgi:hypothetical protein